MVECSRSLTDVSPLARTVWHHLVPRMKLTLSHALSLDILNSMNHCTFGLTAESVEGGDIQSISTDHRAPWAVPVDLS